MALGACRFDRFMLDPADRTLRCDGQTLGLNSRYFDALALLVRNAGKLVTKDEFLDQVWRGVPVTDEALTQCIKTLRRTLGDDAAAPRLIETVPKHGYRFVAPVQRVISGEGPAVSSRARRWLTDGAAGAAGGAIAGVAGGLLYGLAAASQPGGIGAASLLLVLLSFNVAAGLAGGAGVGLGLGAAAAFAGRTSAAWTVAGGALGGMAVGAAVKLIGLDAFTLLFGRPPGEITGAVEGALLGTAIGLGLWCSRRLSIARSIGLSALCGALAGMAVVALGGRLMGGSLDLLARSYSVAQLQPSLLSGGPAVLFAAAALEGGVFCACVVLAARLARRMDGPHGQAYSEA